MAIVLEVGARVSVPVASLPAGVEEVLRTEFTHSNPSYHKQKAMGYFPTEPRTVETWAVTSGAFSVPRGGLRRVREALELAGVGDWDEVAKLSDGDKSMQPLTGDYVRGRRFPELRRVPWDHQRRIVDTIVERECCLVESTMGSGKTAAILMAVTEVDLPALILVWDTGLMRQWAKAIEELLGVPRDKIGVVQGPKRKLASITLAMQQTLARMEPQKLFELLSKFGFIAADEVQRAAASTYTRVVDLAPCRYRVGVTGAHKRKDGKDFLTRDLFGDVAMRVTREEMADAGVVHEVSVVLSPTAFDAPWYRAQKESGHNPDYARLLEQMTHDEKRNAEIVQLVLDRAAAPRRPACALTHRVEHALRVAEMLRARGVSVGMLLGGPEHAAEFEATKRGIASGAVLVGVGTFSAFGVGHDVPALEVGFAMTPVHANREYLGQVTGRVCRSADGKRGAELVVPWDRFLFGDVPARALSRWYREVGVLTRGGMMDVADFLNVGGCSHVDDEEERGGGARAADAGRPEVFAELGAASGRSRRRSG